MNLWPIGSPAPYATAPLPGIQGMVRQVPEDFLVDELPLYAPSGSGEHVVVRIEKRGLSTPQVLHRLATAFGLDPADVGHAGLKDAQAVARQWLSLRLPTEPDWRLVEEPRLRFLQVSRHGNKLRPGHLRGNRFVIVVRGAVLGPWWPALLRMLDSHGFPNLFGEQRLGMQQENASAGRRLLLGPPRRHSARERFCVNAYQALLFNTLVTTRLSALGNMETLLPGDLALLHERGASFAVVEEELPLLQARAATHELSASAPLYGYRVPLAQGQPGAWETALLAREGLTVERFRLRSKRDSPAGERRAVRAFPQGLRGEALPAAPGAGVPAAGTAPLGPVGAPSSPEREPASNGVSMAAGSALLHSPCDLRLEFTLAPGVYATALLREVMKTPAAPEPATLADLQDPKDERDTAAPAEASPAPAPPAGAAHA